MKAVVKIGLIILLTAFLVSSVGFLLPSLSQTTVSTPAITADSFFIELVENKADLTQGTAVFKIRNPLPADLPIDSSRLTARTILAQDATPTKSLQYYILKTFSYSENITDYSTVCNPFQVNDVNGTNYTNSNCTHVVTGWHWRNYTKDEFVPLERETLKANETYTIKFVGTWKPKLGLNSREWFPKINIAGLDYEQSKWAWWNSSWENRQNITVNASLNGWVNLIENVTWNSNMTANFTDIRYTDLSGTQIPYCIYRKVNSGWAEIFVNVSGTLMNQNTTISRYYKNSSAVSPGINCKDTLYSLHSPEFNRNWTKGYNTPTPTVTVNAVSNEIRINALGAIDSPIFNSESGGPTENFTFTYFGRRVDATSAGSNAGLNNRATDVVANLRGYWLVYEATTYDGDLWRMDGAFFSAKIIDGTTTLDTNWHNFTIVKGTTDFTLYIDGTSKGSVTDQTYETGFNLTFLMEDGNNNVDFNNVTFYRTGARAEIFSVGIVEIVSSSSSESEGRTSIENGIRDSLGSNVVIYIDQQIYTRNITGGQQLAKFDKFTLNGTKRWAFNYLTGSDSFTNMRNITPTFYVLEMQNLATSQIRSQVSGFINQTK